MEQQVSADHPGHGESVDRRSLKEVELGCPGISPTSYHKLLLILGPSLALQCPYMGLTPNKVDVKLCTKIVSLISVCSTNGQDTILTAHEANK